MCIVLKASRRKKSLLGHPKCYFKVMCLGLVCFCCFYFSDLLKKSNPKYEIRFSAWVFKVPLPDAFLIWKQHLHSTRGNLHEATAALVLEACWWGGAWSGSVMEFWITAYCGATCALGTYSPAEAVRGQGIVRRVCVSFPSPQTSGFPPVGQFQTPPN